MKISSTNLISFELLAYRYNGTRAYAQSKLANILHAKELSRQLKVNNLCLFFFPGGRGLG